MTNPSHQPMVVRHVCQNSSDRRRNSRRFLRASTALLLVMLLVATVPVWNVAWGENGKSSVNQTTATEGKDTPAAAETTSDTVTPATTAPPLPTSRAELANYLQNLTDEQRQELATKQQQFEQLSDSEKSRLRSLHAKIQTEPNSKQLQNVLQQYSVWLSSLPLKERSVIADTPSAERVERIRQLRLREEDNRLTQLGLTTKDTQIIIDWIQKQASEHETKLLEMLNPGERKWLDQIDNPEDRRGHMLGKPERMSMLLELVSAAEYNRLADQLQPSAQSRLLETSGEDDKEKRIRLVTDWVHASFWTRFRPPEVTKEKLLKFLAELPDNVREELESLPHDRLYTELRNRYNVMQRGRFERWGPRGDGRRGGRPNRDDEDRPNGRNGGKRREFGPGNDRGREDDHPPEPGDGPPPFERPRFGPRPDRSRPNRPPDEVPPEGPPPDETQPLGPAPEDGGPA